jgi:hypothetical protein
MRIGLRDAETFSPVGKNAGISDSFYWGEKKGGRMQTNSVTDVRSLTIEDLKQISLTCYKEPSLPEARKKGCIEKFMNRLGWFRQYEVIVLDLKRIEEATLPKKIPFVCRFFYL